MKSCAFLLAAVLPVSTLSAQVVPMPDLDNPRLQTVRYEEGRSIRLVSLPGARLTLMFHPGERIERVVLSDSNAFHAVVIGGEDALELAPLHRGAEAVMRVATSWQTYTFELATGEGLTAAYLVRLVAEQDERDAAQPGAVPGASVWSYRLSGEAGLRPERIVDDGARTFLTFGPDQALPAVFGLGATGEEEIVAGYMRGDYFVIDRVYPELVFRIDGERARARRLQRGEGE